MTHSKWVIDHARVVVLCNIEILKRSNILHNRLEGRSHLCFRQHCCCGRDDSNIHCLKWKTIS